MRQKTIEVQKGQESNRLSVLRDLTEPLQDYFEQIPDNSDEFKRLFGGTRTVATKSLKITLTVEEV